MKPLERELRYRDLLYGEVALPVFLDPFTRLPEFLRLRYVRLSNVDSIAYKDFATATRWEHGLSAAHLAANCAEELALAERDQIELILAALLHDVATPPFAHTAEYVLDDFDHADETVRLFQEHDSAETPYAFPIFGRNASQFRKACSTASREWRTEIDPDRVAELIVGEGDVGYLVSGFVDVDNLDNVTRASRLMGLDVDPGVPLRLSRALGRLGRPITGPDDFEDTDFQTWVSYRNRLYAEFFLADERELSRQSWLQTLMRRGLEQGLPRSRLVWNTDHGLLNDLAMLFEGDGQLSGALDDYLLLRPSECLAEVPIESPELARRLERPGVVTWLEQMLHGRDGLVSVLVSRRRVPATGTLVDLPAGYLRVFAYRGMDKSAVHRRLAQLSGAGVEVVTSRGAPSLSRTLSQLVHSGQLEQRALPQGTDVVAALDSVGDWSFRRSRNTNFGPYPATWVHSIPASMLRALGLKGRHVWDPFGGTGQTALEGIRYGARVTSVDSNAVAGLIASARTTYLTELERRAILGHLDSDLADMSTRRPMVPEETRDEICRWFHPRTVEELGKIRAWLDDLENDHVQQFEAATFAGILNACSSRRGMGNGHFADNTPIGRGGDAPPYVDALRLFHRRLQANLRWYEGFAAQVGRFSADLEERFNDSRIIVADSLAPELSAGLEPFDAVITSPPYLGMVDYALGQRLPYYWLFPSRLTADVSVEIGTRRNRNRANALAEYLDAMSSLVKAIDKNLVAEGHVGLVIGNSTARAFSDADVAEAVVDRFAEGGFEVVWQASRRVSAHRIHNLHRLTQEQIIVLTRSR